MILNIIQDTSSNPTILAVIYLAVGGTVTLFGNYLLKKLDVSEKVKAAEINSDSNNYEEIKKQLKEALDNIDVITKKLKETKIESQDKDIIILEYKNLLKHFRVLVNILYKQLPDNVKNNPDNMVVLEHIQRTMEDFTL